MPRHLFLGLALLLLLWGCASLPPTGSGKWGGEHYPPGWDDPFYYEKQVP